MSKNVQPVPGAARYTHGFADMVNVVIMIDTDKNYSVIQECSTEQKAIEAADRWQTKENKAVTKEAKRLAKEKS